MHHTGLGETASGWLNLGSNLLAMAVVCTMRVVVTLFVNFVYKRRILT